MFIPGKSMDDYKREIVHEALTHFNGNRSKTSKSLGVAYRTLTFWVRGWTKLGYTFPRPYWSKSENSKALMSVVKGHICDGRCASVCPAAKARDRFAHRYE